MSTVWALGDYHRFATALIWHFGAELVEDTGIGAGMRVLDVATGTGNVALRAAERGARVTALDLEPAQLQRGRAEAGGLDIEWVQGDAQDLPFADGSFDVVTSAAGAIFAGDHARTAAELRRVTRPGGRILCSDFHPIGQELGWRREFSAEGQIYAVRHTWHQIASWQDAADTLGLEVVRMLEPRLDPADIPADAQFDSAALEVPVALVFELLVR